MVDVTVLSGNVPYDWNNTSYTWDTVPATATWDDCYITGHTIIAEYTLTIDEGFSKSTAYKRIINESLPIVDTLKKDQSKDFIESLPVIDRLVRNSNSVIYDLVLRSAANTDLTKIREMARQAQIAGYEDGIEFLPGDYEYKDAVIGVVITNNSPKNKIGFKNIDTFVDTPDIVDRGTIDITNSGANYDAQTGYTTIYYNKPYHFTPSVIASVVGGTQLGDYIFDPEGFTNLSFRVKIVLKSDYTTQITGTLAWEAVGY